MIVINYRSGSLGFFLLSVVYHCWPSLHKGMAKNILSNNTSNHNVAPDLFVDRHDSLTSQQKHALEALIGRPSVVMVHNYALIKQYVEDSAGLINIECRDIVVPTFLFWIKCRRFIVDNARQLCPENPAHGLAMELHRCINLPFESAPGITLQFEDLHDPATVDPFLEVARVGFGEQQCVLDQKWYRDMHARSISHLGKQQRLAEFHQLVVACQHSNSPMSMQQTALFQDWSNWFLTHSDVTDAV